MIEKYKLDLSPKEFYSHFQLGKGTITAYVDLTSKHRATVGLAYCSPSDHFCKSHGRLMAYTKCTDRGYQSTKFRMVLPSKGCDNYYMARIVVWEALLSEIDNNPELFPNWVRREFRSF